jgi:hypothetical protein
MSWYYLNQFPNQYMKTHTKNREINLGSIPILQFDKKIILSIDQSWCDVFKDNNPKFLSKITTEGNYVLVGPKVQPTKKNQRSREASDDISDSI